MSNIFYDKNVLVAGSGVSGTGAKEALLKLGASVTIFCDGDRIDNKHYDFIVLSPSFEKDHYLYDLYFLWEYFLNQAHLKHLYNTTHIEE